MKDAARSAWILAALLAFVPAAQAQAQEQPEGLTIGEIQQFTLNNDPFSGPIETQVMTEHPTVSRGTLNDVFFAVLNHSNDTTAEVIIDLDLRYADGVQVQPFHLGADRAQTLGPDEGRLFIIFWQIPADAPLGTATFTVSARVGRLTGGSEGHENNPNPMVATDSVTFEVVP